VKKILLALFVVAIAVGAYLMGNRYSLEEKPVVSPSKVLEVSPKPSLAQTPKVVSVETLFENGNFKQANELLDKVAEAERDRDWKLKKVRALEGIGESKSAIELLDGLMSDANRVEKASLLWQKAELLIDSGEKDMAGTLYYQIFETHLDSPEAEKSAQKLKDLWKTWQTERDISQDNLIKYNRVLSWIIQHTIDEGVLVDSYQILERINAKIFYSPHKVDGLVEFHEISYGENLGAIAKKYGVAPDRISRVNGLKSSNAIRAGQELRIIKGRVRVVVDKRRFNMDVYLDDLFFKRYAVGLGRGGNTPVVVTQVSRSMAKNPDYTVPDTGELIDAANPKNPIGTRWIGLEMGRGYGIHGTREPDSIGKESSNGCVRMINDQIEELYDFVMVGDEVEIH